ncbi:histone deacetylase domain-containing protein [Lipomyces japonicus]|uniref:histone deacetylase domain-containing protein n=1 Tax=Lipomyces japonicus TaxID=56871 RepID=UPI0034CE1B86
MSSAESGRGQFPSFTFTELLNDRSDEPQSHGSAISEAEQDFLNDALSGIINGPAVPKDFISQSSIPDHLASQLWAPEVGIKWQPKSNQPLPDTGQQQQPPPPYTPVKEEEKQQLSLQDDNEFVRQIERLRLSREGSPVPLEPKQQQPEVITDNSNKTLVLLSPLSYMHVFSRSWVARRYLASIVERPQRLNACAIGIASAVTLSGPDAFLVESSSRRIDLANADHVKRVHGKNWPDRLKGLCGEVPDNLSQGKLEVPDNWNSGDIYLSEGTISALEGVIGAVETGIDNVFDESPLSFKRCFISIRPPGHHSHPCTPSGFCLINNAHVGIQYAAAKHGLTHAVILDFDLHHGDGSQDICWKLSGLEEQDEEFDCPYVKDATNRQESSTPVSGEEPKNFKSPKIGYFSLHDVNSFPTEVGNATAEYIKNASTCLTAHDLCIWNVHLEPYETIEEFEQLYRTRYSYLFTRARQFLKNNQAESVKKGLPFKAAVFLSAGFDASEYEDKGMQRHDVHVPTSFFARFTQDSRLLADEFCEGRTVSVLEGGYSDSAICSGVMSHLLGLQGIAWNDQYGSSTSVRALEKGCKPRWAAPKTAALNDQWTVKAIKLGRSFMPSGTSTPSNSTPSSSAVNTPLGSTRVLRDRKKISPSQHAAASAATRGNPIATNSNTNNNNSNNSNEKYNSPLAAKKSVGENDFVKPKIIQTEDGFWKIANDMKHLHINH